jgi:hypothetical protein
MAILLLAGLILANAQAEGLNLLTSDRIQADWGRYLQQLGVLTIGIEYYDKPGSRRRLRPL